MSNNTDTPIHLISKALATERKKNGLSLTEVAKKAGLAKSTLSQLESGVGNPSLETLWALCVALNIPFSRLIEQPKAQVKTLRKGEGISVISEDSGYVATLLANCPPYVKRDIYLVMNKKGKPRFSEPHMSGVIEHVILIEGKALVGPENDLVELESGDYMSYPGDVPHVFQALQDDTVAVLISEQNY